jgi:hypothetical protein
MQASSGTYSPHFLLLRRLNDALNWRDILASYRAEKRRRSGATARLFSAVWRQNSHQDAQHLVGGAINVQASSSVAHIDGIMTSAVYYTTIDDTKEGGRLGPPSFVSSVRESLAYFDFVALDLTLFVV